MSKSKEVWRSGYKMHLSDESVLRVSVARIQMEL